ncbi:hypothetical protein KW486_17150 [Vibrio fluvialis]|nr:hypothetical protein [Vibrio fluvialis]MBY8052213.1 hypothetical protein [Vibrio fluvialis]
MKNIIKKSAFKLLGAENYEKIIGFKNLGYVPNIKSPQKFSEKISHRKFYEKSDVFSKLSNKYLVREYVKDKIGEQYLTKLYGSFNKTIDFALYDSLPEKFILKSSRGSGANLFFDKNKNNFDELNEFIDENISLNYLITNNENHYNETDNNIIAEELLVDNVHKVPLDYKFFVFNGSVKYIQVDIGRFVEHTRVFYDRYWVKQDFSLKFPIGREVAKPKNLKTMISIAESLSGDFSFVRVDLYNVNNERIVFGEMTFMPGSGRERFTPSCWDEKLGKLWK